MDVRALDVDTWDGFATLVERHNGVWGGCWCMSFHAEGVGNGRSPDQNRADKLARVRDGRAHAALVFDGERCVGWCQFGPTDELPRIKSKRAYLAGLTTPPDWRITCFFTDKSYRGTGVSARALDGAVAEIARAGGGTVESYPEDTEGRTVSGSFLHTGTVRLFEHHGFTRTRRIGKHRWVVTRQVP
jgi:GNAT superfamily N-acetyltransferase